MEISPRKNSTLYTGESGATATGPGEGEEEAQPHTNPTSDTKTLEEVVVVRREDVEREKRETCWKHWGWGNWEVEFGDGSRPSYLTM